MRKNKGFTLITVMIVILFISIVLAGTVPQIVQNLVLSYTRVWQAQTIHGAQGGIMYVIYAYRKYGRYQPTALTLPSGLGGMCANEQSNFVLINSVNTLLTTGNRYVTNWTIKNVRASGQLKLTEVTADWTPNTEAERIQQVRINNIAIWNGSAKSGTKLNVTDQLFNPAVTTSNNQLRFSVSMLSKKVFVTFHFSDGSSYRTQLYPAGGAELQIKCTAQVKEGTQYHKRSIQARYDTPSGAVTRWEERYDHYQF